MDMYRQQLLDMLHTYNATDFETEAVAELIEHVRHNADCFERHPTENAKHLAASTFLVNQDNEILFQWHKIIKRWTQPGGHCDGNGNMLQVAQTELQEETGITTAVFDTEPLEVRRFDYAPSVFGYRKSIYNISYLARVDTRIETPAIREPEKCERIKWMSAAHALIETQNEEYPRSTHCIEKFIARLNIQ